MAWKAPQRPSNKVSQTFNDGVVKIYTVRDSAQPGYAPRPVQTLRAQLPYAERRVGVQRYYASAQNQMKAQRVLRVPDSGFVSTLDIAETEDGQLFRVDLVQSVPDVWPKCVDITLIAYKQGAAL